MKAKFNLFLLFSIFAWSLHAQEENTTTLLLKDFEPGTVIYKNNRKTNSIFNYDLVSGKILFKNNGVSRTSVYCADYNS